MRTEDIALIIMVATVALVMFQSWHRNDDTPSAPFFQFLPNENEKGTNE